MISPGNIGDRRSVEVLLPRQLSRWKKILVFERESGKLLSSDRDGGLRYTTGRSRCLLDYTHSKQKTVLQRHLHVYTSLFSSWNLKMDLSSSNEYTIWHAIDIQSWRLEESNYVASLAHGTQLTLIIYISTKTLFSLSLLPNVFDGEKHRLIHLGKSTRIRDVIIKDI